MIDMGVASLDVSINFEDEDTTLMDMLPDENDFDVDMKFLNKDLLKILDSKLTDKEKQVILYRYGYYDNKPYTLEEVGHKFNVTRERIRQVEKKAFAKISSDDVKEELSSYYYSDGYLKLYTLEDLFLYITFFNEDELNLFISMLSVHELKIFKTVFNIKTLKANFKRSKGVGNNL